MTISHASHRQRSWRDDVRAALSPRTLALFGGTLLLALGFIYSYVAAFHDPTPHEIPVQIAAAQPNADGADRAAAQAADALNALEGHPLQASAVDDASTVRDAVEDGTADAGIVIDLEGAEDTLYVASGGGTSVVSAVEAVVDQFESAQDRDYRTADLVPLGDGDAKGLTGFYLAVGWVVGGYLVASMLGLSEGARAENPRQALLRLAVLVPYAGILGFGGAVIAGPGLGAWDGHLLALGLLGSLTVFAVATTTIALQALLGMLGIGAAVLLFVVLGNPSAGGPYQETLLPGFWSAIGPFIPTGAATHLVRDTVYFGAGGIGWPLLVLAAYAVIGSLITVLLRKPGAEYGDATAATSPR